MIDLHTLCSVCMCVVTMAITCVLPQNVACAVTYFIYTHTQQWYIIFFGTMYLYIYMNINWNYRLSSAPAKNYRSRDLYTIFLMYIKSRESAGILVAVYLYVSVWHCGRHPRNTISFVHIIIYFFSFVLPHFLGKWRNRKKAIVVMWIYVHSLVEFTINVDVM